MAYYNPAFLVGKSLGDQNPPVTFHYNGENYNPLKKLGSI